MSETNENPPEGIERPAIASAENGETPLPPQEDVAALIDQLEEELDAAEQVSKEARDRLRAALPPGGRREYSVFT